MIPSRLTRNSVKPIRQKSPAMEALEEDPSVDENGEGAIVPESSELEEEPGNPTEKGETSDEDVVEGILTTLTPEQRVLLLTKLQAETEAGSDEKES